MKLNDFIRSVTIWGTPACGLLCAVLGAVLAALLLTIGFWKTVFVAALTFAGAFIGGVEDKPEAVKKFINRVLPPRDGQ